MSSQDGVERRTVIYSGQVQGVGFRWTTWHLSRGVYVGGFVRNLENGCVELVAEGTVEELDRFLATVADEMRPYIRNVQISTSPAIHEFDTFTIRH